MIILFEGLTMCFLMLLVCVVGISNGPVGSVYFFEKNVQDRVVELGLTTKEKIKKRLRNSGDMFVYSTANICSVNGLFC